jgi:hypothetical protein
MVSQLAVFIGTITKMIKIIINKNKQITERQTDILYPKITKFFIEKILSDLQIIHSDLVFYYYRQKDGQFVATPGVKINFNLFDVGIDKIYEEYKKYTNDDKIINTPEIFFNILSKLDIYVLPSIVRPDAGGDMKSDGYYGTLRIFLSSIVLPYTAPPNGLKILDDNKNSSAQQKLEAIAKVWNPQIAEQINNLYSKVKNQGLELSSYMARLLTHEFAHHLNGIRTIEDLGSGFVRSAQYRAKGGDKQFYPDTPEYAKSTEEWQARLTEVFNLINEIFDLPLEEAINKIYVPPIPGHEKTSTKTALQTIGQLLKSVKQNNFQNFRKLFQRFLLEKFINHSQFLDKMNQKEINRYTKRLASFFNELKSLVNKEPIFKEIN